MDRADHDDYFARLGLGDLFLDTLPYNAHVTGGDALAAGLPLLTCTGPTFASRVGASLLHASWLPVLATWSFDQYERLALKVGAEPGLTVSVRRKLQDARHTCVLFDTDQYRRGLEAAYMTMWDINCRGEPPRSFRVESDNRVLLFPDGRP